MYIALAGQGARVLRSISGIVELDVSDIRPAEEELRPGVGTNKLRVALRV